MNPQYLIDSLNKADIDAPSPEHVDIQRAVINRDARMVIFQHPKSNIIFPLANLGKGAKMEFGMALRENVWSQCTASIEYAVFIHDEGERTKVFQESLHPYKNPSHRAWIEESLNLSAYEGRTVRIELETTAPKKADYAWALWSNPVLHGVQPETTPNQPNDPSQHHVFLITSDALSRRYMGCYGGREYPTPHMDDFARDSVLFEQAVSQSTTTLGAYASMLSGKSPEGHGVVNEWSPFPHGTLSLPIYFSGRGYDTTLIASESDLVEANSGFTPLFSRVIHSRSNPAQDGSLTLRQFKDFWKKQRNASRPQFTWLQFFDTHPPSLPPAHLSAKFYPHDPEKQVNEPEKVKLVYGVESLVEMGHLPDILERGFPLPGQVRARLLDTANALLGKAKAAPDLYDHLIRAPKKVLMGKSREEFGRWLLEELDWFSKNRGAHPPFMEWLEVLLPELEFIQSSITAWLKDVTDFDYAKAQYGACTHYFDSLFGELIDFLKEQGIYDQSTIILTSPHGEIMEYRDIAFHHHLPHPYLYDVPLLVRTPGNSQAGQRVAGMTQHRDLFPSLIQLVFPETPALEGFEGTSWWDSSTSRTQASRDHSIGYDINDILRSLYAPPYLYVRTSEPFYYSESWNGEPDEEFLFEVAEDEDGGMRAVSDDAQMARMRELFDTHFQRG